MLSLCLFEHFFISVDTLVYKVFHVVFDGIYLFVYNNHVQEDLITVYGFTLFRYDVVFKHKEITRKVSPLYPPPLFRTILIN